MSIRPNWIYQKNEAKCLILIWVFPSLPSFFLYRHRFFLILTSLVKSVFAFIFSWPSSFLFFPWSKACVLSFYFLVFFFYINSLHSCDKNLSELIILLVLPYFLFLLVLLRVSAFLQPETFSFARFYFHINLNNELKQISINHNFILLMFYAIIFPFLLCIK